MIQLRKVLYEMIMAEPEIKLAVRGVVEGGAKIFTQGFKDKELFPCDQMRDW